MEAAHQQRVKHEIPKGAVIMTRNEALKHQFETINNWKPQSDVWPLIYGRGILCGAAGFTGVYINDVFRRKLKLRNFGRIPTVFGIVSASAVTTMLFHTEFVMNNILLLEVPCPSCLVSYSALTQISSGFLLPIVLAPIANFAITVGSGVYNTPNITDIKGISNVIKSAYQPLIPKFTLLFTVHALLASFVTYSQITSFLHMQNIQYLIEQDTKEQMKASNL